MSFKRISITMLLILAAALFIAGCSNDSTTAPVGGTNPVDFSDYSDLVEEIAPPTYNPAQGSPAAIDDWTGGDYPLIGKVFSDDEPMSLYRNINDLDGFVEMLEQMVVTDGEDFESDSSWIEVLDLTEPVDIPAAAQAILGTSIEVEHLIIPDFDEGGMQMNDMTVHMGFTLTDTTEVLLLFHKMLKDGSETLYESQLFYAYHDLQTDEIEIKGVFYKDQESSTHASWVYEIKTVGESDFQYRMAWWGEDGGMDPMVGCIIGGGNKDVKFALKYKGFSSPDFINPQQTLIQMFGPNYSDEGAELATGYESFVLDNNMFLNDDLPTVLLTSPFVTE